MTRKNKQIVEPPPIISSSPPPVLTPAERTKMLLESAVYEVFSAVETGQINISSNKKSLSFKPKISIEPIVEPSTSNVALQLQHLRNNIQLHKAHIVQEEIIKRKEAQRMIIRLQKEKELFKAKINQQRENGILYKRSFSESIMEKMREKITIQIDNKRKELEERVKLIEHRSNERVETRVSNEIEYWSKIKEIEQAKRASTKSLPKIDTLFVNPELTNRKNSKKTFEEHPKEKYVSIINSYLGKAKESRLKISRKETATPFSKRLSLIHLSGIENSGLLEGTEENGRENILCSFAKKRYVHQDKIDIRENEEKEEEVEEEENKEEKNEKEEEIVLQAKNVELVKNNVVSKLQLQWETALDKLRNGKIEKAKGMQMLSAMEMRLDRIDLFGAQDRLRRKLSVLASQEF